MQLHFELKKYFEEEKRTAQKFHESGNLNENTEGGKIVRIMLPWKNVNSFVHYLAKKCPCVPSANYNGVLKQ